MHNAAAIEHLAPVVRIAKISLSQLATDLHPVPFTADHHGTEHVRQRLFGRFSTHQSGQIDNGVTDRPE